MSIEIPEFLQNNSNSLQHVVIKGFRGEQRMLDFVKLSGKSTTVLGRDGKSQMNFANDVVYQYDKELYLRLKKAYDDGDTESLAKGMAMCQTNNYSIAQPACAFKLGHDRFTLWLCTLDFTL